MDSKTEMAATIGRITRRWQRAPDVRDVFATWWYRLAGTESRKESLIEKAKIGGPVVLIAAGIAAYIAFRPVPQPDYDKDALNKVFNYTLLTDEFNRLPVEKRMELIGQLVKRLSNMSAGDSALMAAFATGIAGAARKQIEENASRLAIDLWDKYAQQYQHVKPENRGNFLDQTFLEMIKMGEAMDGRPTKKSDDQILSEVKQQAQRDKEQMRSGNEQPPPAMMGRMFNFMRGNVGNNATPTQRARGQLMMRDMILHFRGEGP